MYRIRQLDHILTVVIDKSGIVRYFEYVPEVTNEPDYLAALAVVKTL